MELSELTAYAQEKYRIAEEHKWNDFPGFSVLCHPETGKWIALLMRQWDTERGEELQRCDMKCGREWLSVYQKPYLSVPVRMHGSGWIGIAFGRNTEEDIVFRLLDEAVSYGKRSGYTIVLGSELPASGSAYKETPLPFAGNVRRPGTGETPERIREMRHLYGYGPASARSRAENFYRQAAFMEDYTDTLPWSGDFVCYFPTYQEMNTRQLRGYFTWRAAVRKGNFQPIAASAAYIYLYELLNGVGASSPEDSLRKMEAFEAGYLDHEPGDERMRRNLHDSLMLVTALNPYIGYDNAAKTAKLAYKENISLREACVRLGFLTPERFDEVFHPEEMA